MKTFSSGIFDRATSEKLPGIRDEESCPADGSDEQGSNGNGASRSSQAANDWNGSSRLWFLSEGNLRLSSSFFPRQTTLRRAGVGIPVKKTSHHPSATIISPSCEVSLWLEALSAMEYCLSSIVSLGDFTLFTPSYDLNPDDISYKRFDWFPVSRECLDKIASGFFFNPEFILNLLQNCHIWHSGQSR